MCLIWKEPQDRQKAHSGRVFHGDALWRNICFIMSVYRTDQAFICLLIVVMVGGEVQESLSSECKQFLYMGTLLRGLQEQSFKKICQFYGGKPRFVTLYDTFNHIPIYSAYTFKRSDGSKKVDVPWMYEPQVGRVALLSEPSNVF